MINKAMQALFWGYLFIFFRLQIGIDWMADPIGYILIASACSKLSELYPSTKQAGIWAAIGIFISLPGVFVNLSEPQFGIWQVYGYALLVLKTIVAFYLFIVLIKIAKDSEKPSLLARTQTIFNFHIGAHLAVLAFSSFAMNMYGDFFVTLSIILSIFLVVMDILFLLLVGAIRRAYPPRPILPANA